VAAIAFNVRTFALDGNAGRVMARLHAVAEPLNRLAVRDRLRALGMTLVPAQRCGDFAQAVMELGALCCTPRTPNCENCPVAAFCRARAHGQVERIPARSVRPPKRAVALACVVLDRQGRLLLVRPPSGQLLGGTWILPAQEFAGEAPGQAAARALERLGLRPQDLHRVGQARHVFTHRDVTATVFTGTAHGEAIEADAGCKVRWIERSRLTDLAMSSFTRKLLSLLPD
jgi:A/G-specific adenine glycosylase